MARRYIVPSLSSVQAYTPPGEEPGTGYPSWSDCAPAIENGDHISQADGVDQLAAQLIITETDLTVDILSGHTFRCEQLAASTNLLRFNGTNVKIRGTGGKLIYRNEFAESNDGALEMSGEGSEYEDLTIQTSELFFSNGADTNTTSRNVTYEFIGTNPNARTFRFLSTANPTSKQTFINPIFKGAGIQNLVTYADIEVVHPHVDYNLFNNPVFEMGNNFTVANGCQIEIWNPSIRGQTNNQPLCSAGDPNAIIIHGGNAHISLRDSEQTVGAGTSTADTGAAGVIRVNRDAPKAYVSIGLWDSKYASEGVLVQYAAECAARGVKMFFATDDPGVFASQQTAIDDVTAFIAAGHEVCTTGRSGSDNFDSLEPLTITNRSASAATLEISNQGRTWEFNSVEDGVAVADAGTKTENEWYLNPGVITGPPIVYPQGPGLRRFIGDINDNPNAGLTAFYCTFDTAGFDDWRVSSFADGVYNFDPGQTLSIALDPTRTIENEFNEFQDSFLTDIGYTIKVLLNQPGQPMHADLQSVLAAENRFTGVIDSGSFDLQPLASMNPYAMQYIRPDAATTSMMGTSGAWRDLSTDADRLAYTTANANRLASHLYSHGGYMPIVFYQYTNGAHPQPDEFGIIIDALLAAGIEIITPSEAIALIGTNAAVDDDDWRPVAGSAGIGSGERRHGGTIQRDVDRKGRAVPDFAIDAGPEQAYVNQWRP